MNSFSDTKNRKWTIDLNVGSAKRVKAACGVDLTNAVAMGEDGMETGVLQSLADDPFALVNVLYSLCRNDAQVMNVDEEGFAEGFDAAVIESAFDALVKEIINFSQPAKRKILTLLYDKTREHREKAERRLDEMLQSGELNRELDEQLSGLYMNTRES